MMYLDNITGYLTAKLASRGKPSVGVSILKGVEDIRSHLPQLATVALDTLVFFVVRNNPPSDPAGIAKLTLVSTRIGHEVASRLFEDELQWKDAVRLGDLFIEAFYQHDLIDLKYSQTRDGSYTIEITEEGKEFIGGLPDYLDPFRLRGTVFKKPANIRSLAQHADLPGLDAHFPLVKGWRYSKDTDQTMPSNEEYDRNHLFPYMLNQPCINAADKLQQVGWRVNEKVLEAVLEIDIDEEIANEEDEMERMRLKSKRIKMELTKRKASALVDKTFYQLLDFDYRGRIYYRESVFNFQGSDYERGLLLFDEAKPVDERGFDWLCIHAACSMNMSYKITDIPSWCIADYAEHLRGEGLEDISIDKMVMQDRINWTLNHLDEIQMTAELNTLSGAAEKPVSYLAVCHEINNYLKYKEAGLTYMSSLPIPIDGSNNGWQHLGAISKDPMTGDLVGLVPRNIQSDFYVQTAKRLIEIVKDETCKDILSSMPMKKIRKGISKRGSMTRAYSAGAQKIAVNMFNDCVKEKFDKTYGISEELCLKLSRDLVKAIADVCPGPLETMKFLQQTANAIITVDKVISWRTPSGFFVEYENFYERSTSVEGTIAGVGKRDKVRHRGMVVSDKPNPRGFACGISPNYIHSLDASHMALVIDQWDGCFGAVHDSFSTHASDVDDLLLLTKDVFVRMYDFENYFDVIQSSFINNYEGFVQQPALGTLDIKEVTNSDYFFA